MSNDIFLKYKDKSVFENPRSIEECFKLFDKDCDGTLNQSEFESLLKCVFSFNGNPYYISKTKFLKILSFYDENKNNKIEYNEFIKFWNRTLKQTLFSRCALIIVDVQIDFIDGSLALKKFPAKEEAAEVVPVINELITHVPFDLIVYTQDWHPADHISFYENLYLRKLSPKSPIQNNVEMNDTVIFDSERDIKNIEQRLWPIHCVQNSEGACFHPDLKIIEDEEKSLIVQKGTISDIDSYSAFFDNCKLTKTKLDDELRKRGITDLYICGLATDVCVAATAYDGHDLKYRIILIENGCKGVDGDDIASTKHQLIQKGAIIVNSKQVYRMVTCEDRRPELGYATVNEQ